MLQYSQKNILSRVPVLWKIKPTNILFENVNWSVGNKSKAKIMYLNHDQELWKNELTCI